jgi:hypothetical protein
MTDTLGLSQDKWGGEVKWAVLKPGQLVMHDGDKKFYAAFKQTLDDAGI